jgi:hypothetical protein
MFLVDSSVWVAHFADPQERLVELLRGGKVVTHPFVLGEIILSSMRDRAERLALIDRLPRARVADHEEVLVLVKNFSLHGRGIGWVDVHLMASARLSNCGLWTLDRKLVAAALHARVPTPPTA